uniref:Interleukin-20-like n=1 Tax=Cyanistes caeruleus TaxID=156563 RepID=A0A8C0VAT0_CYACU
MEKCPGTLDGEVSRDTGWRSVQELRRFGTAFPEPGSRNPCIWDQDSLKVAGEVPLCQDNDGENPGFEFHHSYRLHYSHIPTPLCCITHQLFTFYVDKVFKHCRTEDSFVNRKISSIANSFLSVRRKLGQCREKNNCVCGEESTEKFKQILANYEGLNVTSAAMKSLGELDILLDWMERSH